MLRAEGIIRIATVYSVTVLKRMFFMSIFFLALKGLLRKKQIVQRLAVAVVFECEEVLL
jgi:hypothetical protein